MIIISLRHIAKLKMGFKVFPVCMGIPGSPVVGTRAFTAAPRFNPGRGN